MRSIDTRPPLTLWYRRGEVIAFWLLGCALWGIALWFAAGAAGLEPAWQWELGGEALVVVPGFFWPRWFHEPIRAWNGISWRVAARLRRYVLAVTYRMLIVPIGRSASSPQRPSERPQASGWVPIADSSSGPDGGRTAALPPGDWRESLRSLARTPGMAWVARLSPMIYLLNLFADEHQDATPPGSTYTLY